MSQKDIQNFWEKKKMSVAQDAKKLSFNSQLEQHNDPKIIVTTEEVHEKSEFNESKQRLTPMDESKSIENFFTSNLKKTENIHQLQANKTHVDRKKNISSGNVRKNSPSKPHQYSKLSVREKEQVYLDVYDNNLQLKKKEEVLTTQIKQLNTKLQVIESQFFSIKKGKDNNQEENYGQSEKENLNSVVELKSENQRLKEKLKALSQAKSIIKSKPSGRSKKIYTSVSPNDEKLAESLRIIDILKKRLKDSETQLKTMQEAYQKTGHGFGQSDIHNKNIKLAALQTRYDEMQSNIESQKLNYETSKKRMEDINDQLLRERELNNQLRKEIRAMELSVNHIKDVEAKVKDLEDEKKNLNMRLKDLCESPFIKQHEERANLQFQVRKQETDLQKLTLENKSFKELLIKNETELERTKKNLDDANNELKQKIEQTAQLKANLEIKDRQLGPFKDLDREDDAFLKALGMVKWQGEEPSWYKLDFLERPQKLDIKDPESLLKEIERLRLEKGELAAQLEKSQTLLKIQMESEQEQNKIHQAQISTLELQLRGAILRSNELSKIVDLKGYGSREGLEVYEKNGNKYDDRVSVFSDDASEIDMEEPGTNYFEVWLGNAELDENAIKALLKSGNKDFVFDIKRVLTFMIVDFYNHDSQHSSIAEGTHTNFNFQMSFRVLCDEIFLHHLESGFLKLELYVSEGMETSPIAKANISLKDLVKKQLGEGIAPALSSSITFFGEKNQIIGLLNYRIRMKYPIGESLKWMKEKRELGIIEEEVAHLDENIKRKRKLVIIVDKATGLSSRNNTFVAYLLNGKDFHTTPQPGQTPRWDHTGIHEIEYDETFISYLKTNVLEFILIDDNVPLVASTNITQETNDLIGYARLSINGLITNEIIDSIIPVHGNKNEKRGTLHVKIFWHEGALPKKPIPEDSLITKSWEQELILRICAAIRAKQLNVESAFMIFDQDRDHIINSYDFQATLLGTLNLQIHKDEIELLYQKMPSPLTRENFIAVFGSRISGGESVVKADISKLNVMLQNNTLQLSSNPHLDNTKKIIGQKFAERIRQTSQLSLFKDLDKNGDGYVTLLELKVYFLNMGLKLSDDELYSFISGVDLDRNNKIDIKEFLSYVLAGFNVSSDDRYIEKSISSQSKFHEIDDSNTREITHGKKIDVLLIKMLDAILIFMNNNKLTFLKLYDKIDSDHNNFLTKSELNDFLKKIGLEFNGFSDINALLNHLDENGDNRISIKEFINKIKEHSSNRNNYSLYDDEYSEVSMQSLNSKIVEYICQYLCSSNSSVSDFFNFIDKNNDGILSREELNLLFVKTLKLTLNQDEQSTFFNFLDNNRDNRITIPEFNGIIRPGVEIAMKNQKFMNSSNMMSSAKLSKIDSPYSADFINNLQNKVYEYINRNQTNLKSSFQLKPSENTGFVSQEHFKQVLLEVKFDQINEFTLKEITAIIERLCEKNSNGFINYEIFLELARNRPKKMTNFSIPNVGSSRDMLKSQKMAKEVFEKIAKVVKARNIQLQQAFKTFDMDQDGTIDVEEFKKAFDAMKLNYSAEDVEEIVRVVGVNGKVNYQKFIEALKLK